ncbi:MAG: hypothetical protein SGARI_001932 [Bacillariaceae sp.]
MAVFGAKKAIPLMVFSYFLASSFLVDLEYHNDVYHTTVHKHITDNDKTKWRSYCLADWVLAKSKNGQSLKKRMNEPWAKDTIAMEYTLELDKKSNGTLVKNHKVPLKYDKEVFCDIIKRRGDSIRRSLSRSNTSPLLPLPEDLVLHLRLGDTLDEMMLLDEVEDAFEYGFAIIPSQIRQMNNPRFRSVGWWHYVKSKCYYENVLKKMEDIRAVSRSDTKKKRLVIVGSAEHLHENTDGTFSKPLVSMRYAELVRNFFVEHGYEVTQRLDMDGEKNTPDDDVVWMSHSSIFIPSGGGFSGLAADCVTYLGGQSVGHSSKPWKKDALEHSCWTAPRPDIEMKNYSWEQDGWLGRQPWSGNKNYPPEETIW